MDTTPGWRDDGVSTYAGGALLGAGVGLGARGLKHLYDLFTNRDYKPPFEMPEETAPATKIPVQISKAEAKELERTGVPVTHKVASTFLDNFITSAATVGGAYGGYKLLDNYLQNQRKAVAQKKVDLTRQRVQSLLEDNPAEPDLKMHAQMKAAEDVFFAKSANIVGDFMGEALTDAGQAVSRMRPISTAGYVLGGGAALAGMRAFSKAQDENKNTLQSKRLRDYFAQQPESVPQAELEPIVLDRAARPKRPRKPRKPRMLAPEISTFENPPELTKAASLAALGNRLKGHLSAGSAR